MNHANLVISCPDRPGIVRGVTDFLFHHGANISYLEQHIEDGHFFMRVEWEIGESQLKDDSTFKTNFMTIQNTYNMLISVDFHTKKKRMGIFCSRELHCLMDVLSRVRLGGIDVDISYVISNFPEAKDTAGIFGVPFYLIPTTKTNPDYEEQQLTIMQQNSTDLIILARYMKVLSKNFIAEIGNNAIINVHHSFLPSFVGARPYDEAHERGVKLIGATSHYVIPALDQGPIIEQSVRRISHSYDIDGLKILGRELEKEVLFFAIKKHLENKLIVYKNRVIVFS